MPYCLSLSFLVSITLLTLAQEPNGKFDVEKAFHSGDMNGDKKLSLKEFATLTKNLPRFKDNPALAKLLFDRLDANKDGFLTLNEFKKIADFARNQTKQPAKTSEPVMEKPASVDQITFFEKKIRPVLVAQCYQCHSQESGKTKGGLAADSRDGIRHGGESGPAVIPGNVKDSLLVKAIRHTDKNLQMPKDKLPDAIIADFEKWIAAGAADPREGSAKIIKHEVDVEKGRQFWAFQPVKVPTQPSVHDVAWPMGNIDRFLLADMEAKNLKPTADADAYTLVRRVYFDLIGLPPPPNEVQKFAEDYARDPRKTLEKKVDELLASPQFGERWGRHWLDVARYAESTGRSVNHNYPNAWRYRDYVIAAFNADKPYDRFIQEQLAGDLLPARNAKEKAQHEIATGFLAIGPKSINERRALQFELDLVDEQIDTTFQAFQGLTVACARCHDHKFDPIPTKDYYALAGIFRSTETCYGTVKIIQSNHPSPLIHVSSQLGLPTREERLTAEQRDKLVKQVEDLKREQPGGKGNVTAFLTNAKIALIENKLSAYEADGTPKTFIMGTREKSRPGDSPVYVRGEIDHPAEIVSRGLVQAVTRHQPKISKGSGRLELAHWIASPENPLTARVMVNRIWLHMFGQGLVTTPDNFGASGHAPSHPELLDYLAASFVEKGWSVKKLIKEMVMSRAYQLSSHSDPLNAEIDPDNTMVWRMSRVRLDAEAIRDGMLSISGELEAKPPEVSPVAKAGEGPTQVLVRTAAKELDGRLPYRSVYLPILRDQLPDVLSLFDFPDPSLPAGERSVTTVPSQSLFLMNNPVVIHHAQAAADRILASSSDEKDRLNQAYLRFFARPPSETEARAAQEFLAGYSKVAKKKSTDQQHRAAWTALCQALFGSAEYLYRN